MRRSKVLEKIRAGKVARICCLGHVIPAYIKFAAEFGYDGIWFDNEHRAMSDREVQMMLAYFHLHDIDCILRPPTLEKTRLYRYLEDGATGLMIPHVSTPERAHELAQAVRFPPIGDRGLDGAGLDSDFMFDDVDEYVKFANKETFLCVQIETVTAVNNAEAIAAVSGVDCLFVGPGDLGLRLRNMENPPFDIATAQKTVSAAVKKHGKSWGQPAFSKEMVKDLSSELNAQFLAFGGDFGALRSQLEHNAAEFDEVLNEDYKSAKQTRPSY
ncbi:MAG: 4-hydroxy-2-oxovalerate aldolase [Planctomycetaceae bacterium]|nr:4-hydroxy-2-oxovalerate aldolase [Planctomycetaceae bacterium]